MIDSAVVSDLTETAHEKKKTTYHYEFIFFDIVEPGKKCPFLLVYTVVIRMAEGRFRTLVMTAVSDDSVLEWHKVNCIPVEEIHIKTGETSQTNDSHIYGLVEACTELFERKLVWIVIHEKNETILKISV